MATFEYNALTSAGRLMKGTVEAGSREEAGELLKQMELTVNSIEKVKAAKPRTAIGRNEFMLFNQQLASITKAGIPLERGLRELASDISSRSMRKLIDSIAGELEAGTSIEEAFEKRQKRFPPLYGRILKAGVEAGKFHRDREPQLDAQALEEMSSEGLITLVEFEERDIMLERAKPVVADYAKELGCEDILEKINSIK